jgi:hypothetical protein
MAENRKRPAEEPADDEQPLLLNAELLADLEGSGEPVRDRDVKGAAMGTQGTMWMSCVKLAGQ